MTWWEGRILALDLETTDKEPEDARIVQAAMAFVGAGLKTQAYAELVNPGMEIPEEATGIHGITTEQVREHGKEPVVVLQAIVSALQKAHEANYPVVIFNAPYDLTVLDRELRRQEGSMRARVLLSQVKIVDPLVIDRHLDRYRAGSRKLLDTCKHYGARLDAAHDASFDAIASARLAWALGARGEVVRRVRYEDEAEELALLRHEWDMVRAKLPLLHAAQKKWAEQAQRELQAYFAMGNPKKGVPPQPDRVVPIGWPLYPTEATERLFR